MAIFDGRALEALNDLLDRERAALVRGDVDAIRRLVEHKERAFARLALIEPEEADGRQLGRLREKAERNRELLDAMARGIRAAAARLKRLAEPAPALRTYDRGGHTTELVRGRPELTRRA